MAMENPPIELLPSALSELFADVSLSREVTIADSYGLLAAILSDSLSEEERQCVDRLLWAVRGGRVYRVDKLSALAKGYGTREANEVHTHISIKPVQDGNCAAADQGKP